MEYTFHVYNKLAVDGAAIALQTLLKRDYERKMSRAGMRSTQKLPVLGKPPVVVCIGSDLVIGDSLGPITGSMLRHKTQGLKAYVYGCLSAPVTAKEIKYMRSFLRETHAGSQIIAVDAAVGAEGDIGLIKINDSPLYPGAGANKRLGAIGDISIMGIVAEKSLANYGLLNTTRLNLVYKLSQRISDALSALLWQTAPGEKENLENV